MNACRNVSELAYRVGFSVMDSLLSVSRVMYFDVTKTAKKQFNLVVTFYAFSAKRVSNVGVLSSCV